MRANAADLREPNQFIMLVDERKTAAEPASPSPRVAYFSMEIALESRLPTYSGGLGVLAGDMLRSAADLRMPLIAVTMVFRQTLSAC